MSPITILVLAVIGGGAALVALARLSTHKQAELRQSGVVDAYSALLHGRLSARDGIKVYFFAPQPKPIAVVGRILTILVIAFVIIAIVGIVVIAVPWMHV